MIWFFVLFYLSLDIEIKNKPIMTRIRVKDKSEIAETVIEEGRLRLVKDTQGPWSSINMWHLEIKNTYGHYQEIHTLHVDEAQLLVNATLPTYSSDSNPYI